MARTPEKPNKTQARTAQTGLMSPLDFDEGYVTPKKGDNYDEENVRSVDISEPTKEEGEIATRQEQFNADLRKAKTSKGGKKKRRSTKKTKKVKKVKKHRKH